MRVQLSGHKFEFPRKCACCGGHADVELSASASKSSGKRVIHKQTNVWDFPYCKRCVHHVLSVEATTKLAVGVAVVALGLSLIVSFSYTGELGLTVGVLGIAGAVAIYLIGLAKARAHCVSDCVAVGRAVCYLGWHGPLHQFDVLSTSYALDFMLVNQSKLVNLSDQARNLLGGSSVLQKTNARAPRRFRT